jgi:tetratricopeptide (TPR) repeat protein
MARKRKPQRRDLDPGGPPQSQSKPASAGQQRRERARENAKANKRERLLLFGILAITALVFVNALDGQFVYDDRFQILKNPTLTSLANIPRMFTQGVWQFLNEGDKSAVGPYYRPLFNIALIFNRQLFGLEVFGWHLFSIAVHAVVVFLVYRLARQWRLSFEVAAASALLFGLHPVHSESVAWVAALPDPLAAVFVLSSLLLYERHYHNGRKGTSVTLIASVVLALIAMLSKEVAVVFPLFLIAREMLDGNGAKIVELATRTARRTAPFFAAIVIYFGMRYYVLGFLYRNEPTSLGISLISVLLTIPSVLLGYARMLLIPYPLAVMYANKYVQSAADNRFWLASLAIVTLLGCALWLVRSSAVGRRTIAFMIVFIFPVLNLRAFRQEESLLHDRYLYLPSIGFCILAAMGIDWLSTRFAARRGQVFAAATLMSGAILFGLTFYQNFSWQSELAMTDNAMKVAPSWPYLHNYIGAYHAEQRRFAEAERAYLATIDIDPKYYDAYSNLGDIYREQGKLRDAERCYLNAIEYGARYADTYYNLGVTYTSEGRNADAEEPFRRALEIWPTHLKARYNLGWLYAELGKDSLAEQAYSETLRQDPTYAEPRINLGILLTKLARYPEALTQLRTAQGYAPDHPVLIYALGDLYLKTQRYQEAVAEFKKVDARNLHQNLVHTRLGLCYEGLGRNDEAKTEFQKAIQLAPQDPNTGTAREHLAKLQGGA